MNAPRPLRRRIERAREKGVLMHTHLYLAIRLALGMRA